MACRQQILIFGIFMACISNFVVSTRLIWSGVGVIDSTDQSRQGFEQYDTSEILQKFFCRLFDGLSSKNSHLWYFSRPGITKNENFLTTRHQIVDRKTFSRTSDVSYC